MQLVAKTRPPRRHLVQPQGGQTQLRPFCDLSQGLDRIALAAKQAIDLLLCTPVQIACPRQLRLEPLVFAALHGHQTPRAQLIAAPQAAVVNRLPLLDQLGLFQQSPHLALGLDPVNAAHLLRQAHLLGQAVVRAEVRQDALTQVVGLADVQRQIVVPVEEVHPVPLWHGIQQSRIEMRGPTAAPRQLRHRLANHVGFKLPPKHLPELPQHSRIGQGAMPGRHVQAVPLDQGIQAVLGMLRVQLPRQFHRAQHRRFEIQPKPLELIFQKAVVKPRVVGHKQAAMQTAQHLVGQLGKRGRRGHHVIGDASQSLDETGNGCLRVDQARPLAHLAFLVDLHDADFRDAINRGGGARGFQVHENHGLMRLNSRHPVTLMDVCFTPEISRTGKSSSVPQHSAGQNSSHRAAGGGHLR